MATNYPTSLDSFTNPTSGDDLSDSVGGRTHSAMHTDINDAVEAMQTALGVAAWQTYTPTITASVNPNIGTTGTSVGRYKIINKVMFGTIRVAFGGTGIADGTSNYSLSLPATIAATSVVTGSGYTYRASTFATGVVYASSTTSLSMLMSSGVILGGGTPNWVAGNEINLQFTVEMP